MTLVLTEVSQSGIVMAADTAVTERFPAATEAVNDRIRVLFGVRKLFPHQSAKVGIGIWGAAALPVGGDPKKFMPAEYVLDELLRDCHMLRSLPDVVRALVERLNDRHRLAPGTVDDLHKQNLQQADYVFGADIAGFIEHEGRLVPAIFRVANSTSPYLGQPLGAFRANTLRRLAPFDLDRDRLPRVGGDRYAGAWVESVCAAVYHAAEMTDLTDLPGANLAARRSWWASVARFVSDVYASGYGLRTIGGEVVTLSIGVAPEGVVQIFA